MKAIILAGGEGARLRPLTCDTPKPMTPVAGRPVLAWTLSLLARHGVTDAAVTLGYLPDRVRDYFGRGEDFGVRLAYSVEQKPMGTAGGVKLLQDFCDETVCVLSGDGLTDCDLDAALAAHKTSGAMATIVLTRVNNPLEYGVALTDEKGFVTRFVEKPGWGEATSDAVNTGIYILEPEALSRVPEGAPYDFGRDFFPAMLRDGLPIATYLWDGYWCDIGDVEAYRAANAAMLDARVDLPDAPKKRGVIRMAGARVERGATLEAPCYIGAGAKIRAGARVGAYSVVGDWCEVGAGASLKRAILWDGARVGEDCEARGCVLLKGAVMESRARAFEGSVLGDGSVLGSGSTLDSGVKVWPGKKLGEDARVCANVVWGAPGGDAFHTGCIPLDSPERAALAAQAYCAAEKPKTVVLGRSASQSALACQYAVAAGLIAQGAQVYDAGVATRSELRYALWTFSADGAAHVGEAGLLLLDETGAPLSAQSKRAVAARLARQDFDRPFAHIMKPPIGAGRSDLPYLGFLSRSLADSFRAQGESGGDGWLDSPEQRAEGWLYSSEKFADREHAPADGRGDARFAPADGRMNTGFAPVDERANAGLASANGHADTGFAPANGRADAPPVAVFAPEDRLLSLAERAFERAGFTARAEWEEEMMELAPGEVGVFLDENGERASFADDAGALSEGENQLVPVWTQLVCGRKTVFVPGACTRAAEKLAERFGARIERVCGEGARGMREMNALDREAFCLHCDGLYLALQFLSALRGANLTLRAWRARIPAIYRKTRVVSLDPAERSKAMRRLMNSEAGARLNDRLETDGDGAWAWVRPSEEKSECRVISESYSQETAQELCDLYAAALRATRK